MSCINAYVTDEFEDQMTNVGPATGLAPVASAMVVGPNTVLAVLNLQVKMATIAFELMNPFRLK